MVESVGNPGRKSVNPATAANGEKVPWQMVKLKQRDSPQDVQSYSGQRMFNLLQQLKVSLFNLPWQYNLKQSSHRDCLSCFHQAFRPK